jgi:hypothetical protein
MLYKGLDNAKSSLTNRFIIDESELNTDRQDTLLFIDILDDLADLGLRTYQRNNKTIPRAEFEEEYQMDRSPLSSLRSWLALPGRRSQPAIILARLACLRECLGLIQIGIAAGEPQIDWKGLTQPCIMRNAPLRLG